MAFTKVTGPGINSTSNYKTNHINSTGIITATKFVGLLDGPITSDDWTNTATGISTLSNVGIGTTNSPNQLTVVGNVNITGIITATNFSGIDSDKIEEGNTKAEVVDTGSNGHFKVETEGSERLRIQSTGQLLYSAASGDNTITSKRTNAAGSDGNYFFHLKATDNNDNNVGEFGFHRDTAVDDSRFIVKTRNTGGSSTERLRITSTGQVLLGTTTPSGYSNRILTVAAADNDSSIEIRTATDHAGQLSFSDGSAADATNYRGYIRYEHGDDHMRFGTASTERLRIDSGGSVTIGDAATHTYSAHSEGDDLVVGGAGWRGMTIYGTNGGVIQFADAADNRVGQILYSHGDNSMDFRTNGNQTKLRITSAGLIGVNNTAPEGAGIDVLNTRTTAYSTTSDQRSSAHIVARNSSDSSGRFASISLVNGGGTQAEGSLNLVQTGNYTGDLTFKLRTGSASSDWRERVRITSAGSVGINTTSPDTALQVGPDHANNSDLIVYGNIYGGVGRKNMIDNGDFTCKERYQNSGFAGNDHSYGYVTDRYQNRGGLSHWRQSTNVPTGKGFIYSAKVTNGTGGALQQSIELDRQGHAGIYAVGTFWCVSFWSTQPVNTSSNNGFCQDLGGTNYVPLSLRTPSSGNNYVETGESAAGTATGTFKRYYQVYEVTSAPHANNHTLSFGWAFAYSGSGTNEITGIQVEQVANAGCKPTPYEHVTRAEQQRRCHRYSYRWRDGGRLINGYKRHDDDVHFNFWLPQPMSPYTVSNGGGMPIGAYAWDVGSCTNMGGSLGGTVSNVRLVEYREGCNWVMIMFDYSAGGNNVVIPSWEGMQFEINNGAF